MSGKTVFSERRKMKEQNYHRKEIYNQNVEYSDRKYEKRHSSRNFNYSSDASFDKGFSKKHRQMNSYFEVSGSSFSKHERNYSSTDDEDASSQRTSQHHKSYKYSLNHESSNRNFEKHRKYSSKKTLEDSKSLSDSESEFSSDENDPNFNWELHKNALNKIFFRENDVIKKDSKSYDDIWNFIKKYQIIQKKKNMNENLKGQRKKVTEINKSFDPMSRLNFSVVMKDVERVMETRGAFEGLSIRKIRKFHAIIHLYFDFLQKQKFMKLVNLRKSQASLPIHQYKQTIVETVKLHQVTIIAGDTGCGKSTQVPQFLIGAGYNKIACTQPRRIACISLSKRVAYEMLNEFGSQVGYQIRFDKNKTMRTKILFLTEGLLLRQITSDSLLSMYDVIVLDEVHERHLHGDFLLGVVRCLLKHRSDLKFILMSATINIQLFTNYFEGAPVIQIPGRLYSIKLHYFPISPEEESTKSERINPAPYLRIMQLIDNKYPITERGDLLIFLSGITEITTIVDAAKIYAQQSQQWIILPLHSTLSLTDQDKVFDIAPEGVRKCIVATNIAETSITIDGVRFVVDSGKVKEMNYDSTCKMQRLQEFWISQASAEQRKGRAGRTGPGVCYRLYSEKEYEQFAKYSLPEIQRVPLDSLILQMIAMGLPDARKFPFVEPPPSTSIENSIIFLKEQGAITENERITPIGELLSQLPVNLVIGKILIMGSLFQMAEPMLLIAAALSVQSPFTNKAYRDPDIMTLRFPLECDHGDPFTLLNIYTEWLKLKANHDTNTRKWCKRRGLEEQRLYEMTKLRQQFKDLLQEHHLLDKAEDENLPASSEERQRRFGELKRLRGMKRSFHHNPKKKKILKLDIDDDISSPDEREKDIDIKDVEFQLVNDKRKVQDLARKTQVLSIKDISLLKIIICSGLYPQIAISDEYNTFKKDSDQIMHTKAKPFVILHPNSILATQPDILKLEELDIYNNNKELDMKHPFSHKHQLIVFVSLLETIKPYLINNMRVPALPTMALFAKSIDSDASCSRLIFDEWLEIKFNDVTDCQKVMAQILEFRAVWSKLLSLKLKDSSHRSENSDTTRESQKLGKHVAGKLVSLFNSHLVYSIKRILAADLNNLYVGLGAYSDSEMKLFYSDKSGNAPEGHPVKGGVMVTDFFNYNCLLGIDSASFGSYNQVIQTHWTCSFCETSFMMTVLERLQHESTCISKENIDDSKPEEVKSNVLKKPYTCPECQKQFLFSATEILKHKRSHKNQELS